MIFDIRGSVFDSELEPAARAIYLELTGIDGFDSEPFEVQHRFVKAALRAREALHLIPA